MTEDSLEKRIEKLEATLKRHEEMMRIIVVDMLGNLIKASNLESEAVSLLIEEVKKK